MLKPLYSSTSFVGNLPPPPNEKNVGFPHYYYIINFLVIFTSTKPGIDYTSKKEIVLLLLPQRYLKMGCSFMLAHKLE